VLLSRGDEKLGFAGPNRADEVAGLRSLRDVDRELDAQLCRDAHERLHARIDLTEWWEIASISHMLGVSGIARLDDRGRLVLPAELRRRLGLGAGDQVTISEEADGVLRVQSRQAAARALIGSAGREQRPVLTELHADRRRQAAAEDRDAARHG
jgi:AbrB family looped-hinge helix DNA binding protein